MQAAAEGEERSLGAGWAEKCFPGVTATGATNEQLSGAHHNGGPEGEPEVLLREGGGEDRLQGDTGMKGNLIVVQNKLNDAV